MARDKFFITINAIDFIFQAENSLYTGDGSIFGAEKLSDSTTGASIRNPDEVKRNVPRMAVERARGDLLNNALTNAQQANRTSTVLVYVAPLQIDNVLKDIKGKQIGGREAVRAYFPLKLAYV